MAFVKAVPRLHHEIVHELPAFPVERQFRGVHGCFFRLDLIVRAVHRVGRVCDCLIVFLVLGSVLVEVGFRAVHQDLELGGSFISELGFFGFAQVCECSCRHHAESHHQTKRSRSNSQYISSCTFGNIHTFTSQT